MTFMITILFVVSLAQIAIVLGHSHMTLVWNEEFTSNQIDLNNWNVEDEKQSCTGNYIRQLQCHTSKSDNVRVSDGVLGIIARKENHLDKEYTSGKINTKFGFTYGKVEIKASIPSAKMLRPAIWMLPVDTTLVWPKNGEIDIITNTQTTNISSGVHFFNGGARYMGDGFDLLSDVDFSAFHVYQIEWTPDYIEWSFDGTPYYKFETNKKLGDIYERNGQPFDQNFLIYFQLGIGGQFFPGLDLTEQDVRNWNCPLFIIDYVRVYQVNDDHGKSGKSTEKAVTQPLDDSDKSVNCICAKMMGKQDPSCALNMSVNLRLSKTSLINYMPLLTVFVILTVKAI